MQKSFSPPIRLPSRFDAAARIARSGNQPALVRVTTNQTAGTAAKTSSAVLKLEATGMERLRPVASAT